MITNTIYSDGFGENFKFIIYTILYAEFLNKEFHYTPLNFSVEHNYDNDKEFINKKEKLVNIINNYPTVQNNNEYERPDRFELLYFFENNLDFCMNSKSLKKLKSIFREANENKFDKSFFNVAIHIRRMNVLDIEKNVNYKKIPGTDVPNNIYTEIITQLKNIYKNCKIHVYSQGDKKDFIFEDHVDLHLNESIETTFIDLVFADVLIMAPSTFSYSAGLLSDGIIYYIYSCHKPLSFWNLIQNYKSTKDRYDFFIKNTSGVKLKIYYDTVIGHFYKDTDENGREYINIFEYLIV